MIEKELVTLPGGKEEGFLGDAASHIVYAESEGR